MGDVVDAALESTGVPRQAAPAQPGPGRADPLDAPVVATAAMAAGHPGAQQGRPAADPAVRHGGRPDDPMHPPILLDGDIDERRAAASQLAAVVRELAEASVRTLAPVDTMLDIARRLADALPVLTAEQREIGAPGPLDDPAALRWYHNPVVGTANPLALPLETTLVDGILIGRCTPGLAYQGPRGYVHGGVSALLLDQLLGDVVSASGRSGLTVSLATRYRRAVPLGKPLLLAGRLVEIVDGKITTRGTIALESDPQTTLVEAVGTFVIPRPDQAAKLFGAFGAAGSDTPGTATAAPLTPATPAMPAMPATSAMPSASSEASASSGPSGSVGTPGVPGGPAVGRGQPR